MLPQRAFSHYEECTLLLTTIGRFTDLVIGLIICPNCLNMLACCHNYFDVFQICIGSERN